MVNSFSKYFSMTGWRLGWLVVPEALVRPVERLSQSLYISVPYLSQVAAEAAFEATALMLVHNHPSGSPEPSRADVAVTNRIAEAGRLLGAAEDYDIALLPGGGTAGAQSAGEPAGFVPGEATALAVELI